MFAQTERTFDDFKTLSYETLLNLKEPSVTTYHAPTLFHVFRDVHPLSAQRNFRNHFASPALSYFMIPLTQACGKSGDRPSNSFTRGQTASRVLCLSQFITGAEGPKAAVEEHGSRRAGDARGGGGLWESPSQHVRGQATPLHDRLLVGKRNMACFFSYIAGDSKLVLARTHCWGRAVFLKMVVRIIVSGNSPSKRPGMYTRIWSNRGAFDSAKNHASP